MRKALASLSVAFLSSCCFNGRQGRTWIAWAGQGFSSFPQNCLGLFGSGVLSSPTLFEGRDQRVVLVKPQTGVRMILPLSRLNDRGVYSVCLYIKRIVLSQGDSVSDQSVIGGAL